MHNYRPDIDGMRALAVIAVVGFHAGLPGFSGGFVGVDIFFVISGYLITSIILGEMSAGTFTIARFYERRARRILPALFAVLAACVPLSAYLLYPDIYDSFARSLIAATLFVASFQFKRESGYFDLEAGEKPLLHTWSLSVEEIFYLFFPWLLLALKGRRDRQVQIAISICAVLSFVAAVLVLYKNPLSRSAFFLPHLRAWEFLIGSALVLLPNRQSLSRPAVEAASLGGLGLILVPIFYYSQNTVFPGLAAVPPCLGTALLIQFGRTGGSGVHRLLSNPAAVFVGLISYSLYLWHWPLLVFAQLYRGSALSGLETGVIIALALLLSVLSWRFVERPFRGRNSVLGRRQIFALSGVTAACLVTIGLHGVLTQGWISRFPPQYRAIMNASEDVDPRQDECLSSDADARGCIYGNADRPSRVALWGDSHGAVYAQLLGALAAQAGLSAAVFTMPSCPPLEGWAIDRQRWRTQCLAFQSYTLRTILKAPAVETVVLAARFHGYPFLDTEAGFAEALEETIKRLKNAGKRVAIVFDVPEYGGHVPHILNRHVVEGKVPDRLTRSRAEQDRHFASVDAFLNGLVAQYGLIAIRPRDALCDKDCYFYRGGEVYVSDEHHLSLTGARQTKSLFSVLFNNEPTQDDPGAVE